MMTRMCYMMHTGKLDILNTMNDIQLKTIELGLIIYLFISYFSFLPFYLSYMHLFILFLLCFVLVYFSQCGIKTKALFLLMFDHAVMMYFIPFNPNDAKLC